MNLLLPVISFFLSLLITPLVIRLARSLNLVTDSKSNSHPAHTHQGVLPRAGGLPIFLGLFIPLIFFVLQNKILGFVFLGAILVLIIGLIDDRYNLSPYLRFLVNIISATLAVLGGIGIPFVSSPFSAIINLDHYIWQFNLFGVQYQLLWLADLLSIVWIVWCMNIINWSKGVDGQQPGFVFIASCCLGLLAMRFTRHNIPSELVSTLAFCTGAAYLGFLPWNFYPQKILPGYSGGALAGYLLSIISILAWGKFSILTLILVLPFTDALIVFSQRLIKHKSPFVGDRGHFHHHLLDLGWSRRRIAVFYWLITLITGVLALILSSDQLIIATFILMLFFAGVILGTQKLSSQRL